MRRVALTVSAVAVVALCFGGAAVDAQDHEFVGSKKCKKCHLKQFKSWEETAMAQTFESLKPGMAAEAKTAHGLDPEADYTADTACVGCHVTGYGMAGGFVDVETTPDLVGVGCEECHGAGGTYIQDGYMTLDNKEYKKADLVAVGLVDEVGIDQCSKCHNNNPDNPFAQPDFQFDPNEGIHEHHPLKYEH